MVKDANAFLSDILTVTDAVARRLSIIGEALSKATKLNSTIKCFSP